MRGAAQHAEQHSGDSGDSSLFSSVLGYLGQNKHDIKNQEVDEEGMFVLIILRIGLKGI